MRKRALFALLLAAVPFSLGFGRCQEEALTAKEALQALEEVSLSGQATILAGGTVEIATNFTIGQAVEEAAQELVEFIESQLPCAEITLVGAQLTVEYGVNPGDCAYNGQEYTGTHIIEVLSADLGGLVVQHEWIELSNGVVEVSGEATVTWSSQDSSRNVVHALTWTRLADDKTVDGEGDHTQTVLTGGLLEGISTAGERTWTSDLGDWDLTIDDVEIRWIDPVPQSGSYRLDTPFDKFVTMEFERVDSDTITVIVSSGSESFEFEVTSLGDIT